MSDARTRRIGLRSVQHDDGEVRVNGERLFLKGAHLEPGSLDDDPAGAARAAVRAALDAGLDHLRVRGHVADRALYRAADEHGLLLWQDLPVSGRPHRSMRHQAARQARELVDLLAHHPSVWCWCGREGATTVSIVDRPVTRALRRADDARPVVAHSAGLLPQPDADRADGVYALVPRLARFVVDATEPLLPERVETLRRLKHRPTGGFVLGRIGADDEVLTATCRPVAVVADRLPPHFHGDEAVALDVHAVSDLRRPLDDVVVSARLRWTAPDGSAVLDERRWTGTIPADDCVRIGTLQLVVPHAEGRLDLEVHLDHPDHSAAHHDTAAVLTGAHDHT